MSANIPEIYTNFNTWIDNNTKLLELQANSSAGELEQNQEYQNLSNSTSSVFNLNQTEADRFYDSLENLFGMNKNEETVFDRFAKQANKSFGLQTEENYNNNLAQLGQGELLEKDTDNSGELSLDEYIDAELADLGEEAGLEEKAMVAAQSQALFQILDEGTSVADKSGELNSEELASYYKNVDRFENGTLVEEGTQDGVFSVDDAAGLTQFLMENMISQEYLEELYELYLEKYTLESQQK